jgi:hypothetical protein
LGVRGFLGPPGEKILAHTQAARDQRKHADKRALKVSPPQGKRGDFEPSDSYRLPVKRPVVNGIAIDETNLFQAGKAL